MDPEQNLAIESFRTRRFLMITGGPGNGKTTVIKNLIVEGEPTLLCAPTGNAADRLFKACGRPTYVIARLEFSAELINKWKNCNLIVDEASMVSVDTLSKLITYLQPKRLVLVGDPHQLPPVEGRPALNTLLKTKHLPRVELIRNHRTKNVEKGGGGGGGDSLSTTLEKMRRNSLTFPLTFDGTTLRFVECQSDDDAIKKASESYNHRVQMLAFTNSMCKRLNVATAAASAGGGGGNEEEERVVCTHNLYDDKKKLLVANGVIGRKKMKRETIEYENGYVDKKKKKTNKFNTQFEPARAMTVHKSQGNEFEETGFLVLGGNWQTIPLELTYTGLSRFRNDVVVFGTKKALEEAFCKAKFSNSSDEDVLREYEKRGFLRCTS